MGFQFGFPQFSRREQSGTAPKIIEECQTHESFVYAIMHSVKNQLH